MTYQEQLAQVKREATAVFDFTFSAMEDYAAGSREWRQLYLLFRTAHVLVDIAAGELEKVREEE